MSLTPASSLALAALLSVPAIAPEGPRAGGAKRWMEGLRGGDPFESELAAAELRKLGPSALESLVPFLSDEERVFRFRLERIVRQILDSLLDELDGEYRALDADRRELHQLRRRAEAFEELGRLEAERARWREQFPGIEAKLDDYLRLQRVEALQAPRGEEGTGPGEARPPAPDERGAETGSSALAGDRSRELKARVAAHEAEIPGLPEKAAALERLRALEVDLAGLKPLSEVEILRLEDLGQRAADREPQVESLVARLRAAGPVAFSALASRREALPLERLPGGGDWRPAVVVFYDSLLEEAAGRMGDEASLFFPEGEGFERSRYLLSLLWEFEAARQGPAAARAEEHLGRHLRAALADLEAPEAIVRERAAQELYLLGDRGLGALREAIETLRSAGRPLAPLDFLAHLCRWRIAPETYVRVGIDFRDYPRLSFTARRRKIFQYSRAAGRLALPTLRRLILDDELEESFLVKYAAAKALGARLGDRLGYLVLQSRHPELVLRRPEISRDLLLIEGLAHIQAKDYARAVREFEKILEEFPFDFDGNYHIAFAYLLLGNHDRAIHHFEIARRIRPGDMLTLYNLACAYSLGGHPREALEALESSVEAGFHDADHMEKDPDLDPLRDHPRYREILEKARRP